MKLKSIFCGILGVLFCMACTDEENIISRDTGFSLRFEFPQGTNEWDDTAKEIQEKFGVYLIYEGVDSSHLRQSWTTVNALYAGESLTDEQAKLHLAFMKEHIFAYLTPELTKQGLPIYYYLIYNYRATPAATAPILNNVNGVDFWVSSIFSKNVPKISTWTHYRERRYRNMRYIFENLCKRGNIVASKEFHVGFNYETALASSLTDNNHYKKRGFPGTANGDNMNIGPISNIYNITPLLNFIAYINLGMRYVGDELEKAYPKETYPLIHMKRDYVVKYMKEEYNVDLEAIAQGPEL